MPSILFIYSKTILFNGTSLNSGKYDFNPSKATSKTFGLTVLMRIPLGASVAAYIANALIPPLANADEVSSKIGWSIIIPIVSVILPLSFT